MVEVVVIILSAAWLKWLSLSYQLRGWSGCHYPISCMVELVVIILSAAEINVTFSLSSNMYVIQ
jgi:hypothetical protein